MKVFVFILVCLVSFSVQAEEVEEQVGEQLVEKKAATPTNWKSDLPEGWEEAPEIPEGYIPLENVKSPYQQERAFENSAESSQEQVEEVVSEEVSAEVVEVVEEEIPEIENVDNVSVEKTEEVLTEATEEAIEEVVEAIPAQTPVIVEEVIETPGEETAELETQVDSGSLQLSGQKSDLEWELEEEAGSETQMPEGTITLEELTRRKQQQAAGLDPEAGVEASTVKETSEEVEKVTEEAMEDLESQALGEKDITDKAKEKEAKRLAKEKAKEEKLLAKEQKRLEKEKAKAAKEKAKEEKRKERAKQEKNKVSPNRWVFD